MKKYLEQIFEHPIFKRYFRIVRANLKIVGRKLKLKARLGRTAEFFGPVMERLPEMLGNSMVQVAGVVVISFILTSACIFFQVGNRFDKSLYVVNIPKGYGARQVADLLQSKGIIDGKYGFNLIINMFGLQNRMLAGTYEFTPNMSLIRIIWKIRSGEIIPPMLVKLILPEGMSIYKMSKVMILEGVGDGLEFQQLTKEGRDPKLMKKYPFLVDVPTDSLEGYLFPDTYLVPANIGTVQLADLMLSRFNRIVMPYWRRNSRKMKVKMSLHDVLTLASIIEKEAAVYSERATISSVYHNRLSVRMHLGADPTIKYVLESPGKIVSYDDLNIKSPYNTYKNYGLPPGPICSPGLKSIKAAMFPVETDYIYFVARADGSHIFSKTWQEHEEAKAATKTERIRKLYRRN